MPSLDFVYDLVEKFEEDNIEYLILTLRQGKTEDKVDVFFNINSESEDAFIASVDKVKDVVKNTKGKNASTKRKRRKKKE
tara:strand:+ start:346 stop:585 length:240 start_codon:yes stop_codon:yes gene_type:complete